MVDDTREFEDAKRLNNRRLRSFEKEDRSGLLDSINDMKSIHTVDKSMTDTKSN
jgi:hypothetical protein